MKLFFFLPLTLLLAFGHPPSDKIEWLSPVEHDFGDLPANQPDSVFFRFKNISPSPMVIDNVRPSCGCTVPDWSIDPIAPGQSSQFKIVYDARRPGYFRKKIKVYFSAQKKAEVLYVEGYVVP